MKCRLSWFIAILCWAFISEADTLSTTQTLSVGIAPLGKLSVPSAILLLAPGTTFSPYTGALAVSYRVRTTPTAGGGLITMQTTSDFSPSGGPSISGGALRYGCNGATLGTPCSGTQTLPATGQVTVLAVPPGVCTGGGTGGCSAADPNSLQVLLTLDNDPQFQTGSYSASITFTISAT
jgi:hypothetical protein